MKYDIALRQQDGKFYVFDQEVSEKVYCEASAMRYNKRPESDIRNMVAMRIGRAQTAHNNSGKPSDRIKPKGKKEKSNG